MTSKTNNWVNISTTNQQIQQKSQKINDSLLRKTMSIQKVNEHKKFDNTQNKFMEIASSVKQNIKLNKRG